MSGSQRRRAKLAGPYGCRINAEFAIPVVGNPFPFANPIAVVPDLFQIVVAEERLHESFRFVRESWSEAAAREVMQLAFEEFDDVDGNFREQFQTSGFDARVWELYVSRYLNASGFAVQRLVRPDFVASRNGTRVAIEAMSSNPTQGMEAVAPNLETQEGVRWLADQYLPIKFGSTLYSKLRQRYWEEEEVRDVPLVFAIQSYAFEGSLGFSSNALAYYLYGLKPEWFHDAMGRLHVRFVEVESFVANDLARPARFFGLPDAAHVSAVLFANSGTVPKFNRMGYQEGASRNEVVMRRVGMRFDHDPNSAVPLQFNYEVGTRMERWGEGIDVFHNPNASRPLADGFFRDAADHRLEGDLLTAVVPHFHPYASMTLVTRRQ